MEKLQKCLACRIRKKINKIDNLILNIIFIVNALLSTARITKTLTKNNIKIRNTEKTLKKNKMFLLQCPKCKNRMKYQSKDTYLSGKKKKCVYCGKSFAVNKSFIKKI